MLYIEAIVAGLVNDQVKRCMADMCKGATSDTREGGNEKNAPESEIENINKVMYQPLENGDTLVEYERLSEGGSKSSENGDSLPFKGQSKSPRRGKRRRKRKRRKFKIHGENIL